MEEKGLKASRTRPIMEEKVQVGAPHDITRNLREKVVYTKKYRTIENDTFVQTLEGI
jgi:hypothetical protein